MKQEQHILITGGATRLGRQVTEHYIKKGFNVSLFYFSSEKEAQEIKALAPNKVHLIKKDLTQLDDIQKWDPKSLPFGKIDVFIYAASIFTKVSYDKILNSNFTAAYLLSKNIALHMKPQGNFVFICDVFATKPLKSFEIYCSAKAALRMLAKSLALELAPHTRVNSISPGTVLPPVYFTPEQVEVQIQSTLLKRLGSPKDIIEGISFLTESTYITGFDLVVDGGKSLMSL
jgi:pteridine reductase